MTQGQSGILDGLSARSYRFRSWLLTELGSAYRDLRRAVIRSGGQALILSGGHGKLSVAMLRGGQFSRLGVIGPDLAGRSVDRMLARWRRHAGGDHVSTYGLLPPSSGLTRRLRFPASAEAHLKDIIRNQINRLSPFEPDQVHFDFHILQRHHKSREIEVLLVLAPRDAVREGVETFKKAGCPVDRITVADGQDPSVLQVNLLPGAAGKGPDVPPGWRRLRGFARLNMALFVALILVLIAGQGLRWAFTEMRLASIRAEAEAAQALQENYKGLTAEARFFARLDDRRISALRVVNDLSAALPEDTWLELLDLNPEKLEMRGVSRTATGLIMAVDRLPIFSETNFPSPIISRGADGLEQFHIAAKPHSVRP